MKQLLLSLIVAVGASSAMGMGIVCQRTGNPYSMRVQHGLETGFLYYQNKLANFGNLTCYSDKDSEQFNLSCVSTHVNDAGYNTQFATGPNGRLQVTISEVSFYGSKNITTLPCKKMTYR